MLKAKAKTGNTQKNSMTTEDIQTICKKMVAVTEDIKWGHDLVFSIGAKMFSGVGGQMDFIRGATLSQGGKAIIALPSITKRGAWCVTCERPCSI